MNLEAIQSHLALANLDGWLFVDFRGSDPLAAGILGLDRNRMATRRWAYFIPKSGQPTRIVHAIETGSLDAVPGTKLVYLPWSQLHEHLRATLAGSRKIAMQYSPLNAIPYVSRVDAGTVDLIRSFGVEVVSSANLVQRFEATMSPAQVRSHLVAADRLGEAVHAAFEEIGRRLNDAEPMTEYDIQHFIWKRFADHGLIADHPPIVAVEANAADPHYCPSPSRSATIGRDQFVLIDAWCKLNEPGSIYADICWVGFTGQNVPEEYLRVFEIVRQARDRGVEYVQENLADGKPVRGCDVDDACRAVIVEAGFGEQFIHRTGHSIHESDHGNGANIDNLETRDDRLLIPRTCFSIEPGIYLPGRFGVRLEINVLLEDEVNAIVTGLPRQMEILRVG